MQIKLIEISIKDLYEGYKNNDELGVFAYSGKLNVRPPYQREFRYNDKQQKAVIETVLKGFPLNTFFWGENADGTLEIIDGQQRTLSICEYLQGRYSIKIGGNDLYYHNLPKDILQKVYDYKLMVYVCEGTDSEKLDWFKVINIAGEKLTDQELINAVYTGPWLSDAKKHFSKTSCPAYVIGKDYMKGVPIKQDYLETVLEWISNDDLIQYMAKNQSEPNCNDLWLYFQSVINWAKAIFPKYDTSMKGLDWGLFYNKYKTNKYDPTTLQAEITKLIEDDDVTKKAGVYEYLLSSKTEEKSLSIRAFTDSQKRAAYSKQHAICPLCSKVAGRLDEMEADHITPWSKGGKTIPSNLQMICKLCNRTKSSK